MHSCSWVKIINWTQVCNSLTSSESADHLIFSCFITCLHAVRFQDMFYLFNLTFCKFTFFALTFLQHDNLKGISFCEQTRGNAHIISQFNLVSTAGIFPRAQEPFQELNQLPNCIAEAGVLLLERCWGRRLPKLFNHLTTSSEEAYI